MIDSDDYAPTSGDVVCFLKSMGDEMNVDIADMKKNEGGSVVAAYDALMASKKKEAHW